tara:strand:- start:153 stop:383 length:231 start_codon:yes stop_codon:yes gene_type:complete
MSEEDIKKLQEENIKKDYFLKAMKTEIEKMKLSYNKDKNVLREELKKANKRTQEKQELIRDLRIRLEQYRDIANSI